MTRNDQTPSATEGLPVFPIEPVENEPWVRQGDIYRDVEYIESYDEDDDGATITVAKLVFPLAVVLGQDCDLLSDGALRNPSLPRGRSRPSTSSAAVITTLLTPLYNSEAFFRGDHCSNMIESLFLRASTTSAPVSLQGVVRDSKDARDPIMKGENNRFQYLHFGAAAPIVDCVVDFKHYFSVRTDYLVKYRAQCLGCIRTPFRESLSQRFSFYLSRIGLPD